jgi:tetratricopeptide (TPR) repeat protein
VQRLSERPRARYWPDFLVIGVVAFGVRVAHAWFVSRTPFFAGPVIDAEQYRAFAQHIAETGEFGGAFYQPPLYPAFLALLFRAGLGAPWPVALVQSALGTATVLLLMASAPLLTRAGAHGRAVALCTGAITALYGPLVLFDVELLPPCCVNLLLAAALRLALRRGALDAGDALLGLLLGLGVVAWPPSAVLGLACLALRLRALTGRRSGFLLLAAACGCVPVALTARHNAHAGAPGVAVSYNLGINLWLGNNPHWRETWRARPGAAFEPELERPDREGVTEPSARSDYFVRLAVRDMAARPWAALKRTAEKLYYVACGREIRRDQDIELLREASPVLRALQWESIVAFPFGLLAPLGVLGLWRRRKDPDAAVLALALLAYALLLAVFFVSARYRLPLVLVLIPFAAEQLLALRHAPKQLAPFAALVMLSNLPNDFSKTFAASATERGVLTVRSWRNQGNFGRALDESTTLVARFGDDPDVRMMQGQLLIEAGRYTEAVTHLQKTIDRAPRTVSPRLLLADCWLQLGRPRDAERSLAGALALHPYHPLGLKQAASLYLHDRRSAQARTLLRRFAASGYRDRDVEAWLLRVSGQQR